MNIHNLEGFSISTYFVNSGRNIIKIFFGKDSNSRNTYVLPFSELFPVNEGEDLFKDMLK